jgi:hypothetical protein
MLSGKIVHTFLLLVRSMLCLAVFAVASSIHVLVVAKASIKKGDFDEVAQLQPAQTASSAN